MEHDAGSRPVEWDAAGNSTARAGDAIGASPRIAASESHTRKVERYYRTLLDVQRAISGLTEPQALFREICRICVENKLANAALVEVAAADRRLIPKAWSGRDQMCLRALREPREVDPSATGVRINGCHASVAFHRGGDVSGMLHLFAERSSRFDAPMVELFCEIGTFISMGLDRLDRKDKPALPLARAHAGLEDFGALFRLLPVASCLLRVGDTRILEVNDAFCRLFEYSRDELSGSRLSELALLATPEGAGAPAGNGGGPLRDSEMKARRKSGETRTVLVNTETILSHGSRHELMTLHDITDRKVSGDRFEFLANHDETTGLPNRALICDRIAQALAAARRAGSQLAVLFLDLDRFKIINDVYGHAAGDALLRGAAQRLTSIVREGDTVARLGGDEFLILLPNLQRSADAYVVSQKLLDSFDAPIQIGSHAAHVKTSIGVAIFPQDGQDVGTLIRHADIAMYRAKDQGGGMYQFFNSEISRETLRRSQLETHLRSALARSEMVLHYQPKVEMASRRIVGCEALIRWNHPGIGTIKPAQFIPIAEESGLIVPIGDWVLKSACAQAVAWREAGIGTVPIAVNVSPRQFLRKDVVAWVMNTLRETHLAPDMIELELTESLIAEDPDKVASAIKRLKNEGVRVSIDDFGTGYSSLSALKRFAVDALKIDRSLVKNVGRDPSDDALCLAVISLAHSLGLKVVAEGVETSAQCEFLDRHGCDRVQGYLFGRPVAASSFADMLKR